MGLDLYFKRTRSIEVGYFRKVNFLVGFFSSITNTEIENLQPIEVTKEDCEELLNRCNKVLENHELAEELLPTYSGFFFGTYEYDEWYFKDVKAVKEYLEEILLPTFKELDADERIEFEIWY